jgi:chromosome segregation ATPase
VALFAIINLVVVGVQKLAHMSDQKELDSITRILKEERPQLEAAEGNLRSLALQLDTLEARMSPLETTIKYYETTYPIGIPSSLYADYSAKVDEYNSLIDPYNAALTQFKILHPSYQARIDAFNSRVDEAERLAAKIGSTWILVPRLGAFVR